MLLLYGDNGSGKSTILNIVFHLLHPEPYGGHRTAVGKIPFRMVKIGLTSGYVVVAEKQNPFDESRYRLQLSHSTSKSNVEYTWEYERRKRDETKEDYLQYCKTLEQIGLTFHFLSDTRRVSGQSDDASDDFEDRFLYRIGRRGSSRVLRDRGLEIEDTEISIDIAINRTIEGLRRLALTGTNEGYTSVNTIYEELIRGILQPGKKVEERKVLQAGELRKTLQRLNERNSSYAKYGLTPELDIDPLLKSLETGSPSNVDMLNTVLKPYFDGHEARLNALQPVQKVIDDFATLLTEFLSHKTIELDVKTGFRILDINGNQIPAASLSSGERQLVVLFCNAVTARRNGTILIIDEPEISLNVKWQRRLVSALLTCLEGVESQIVLATHSIEILSRYQDYVVTLNDRSENKV